MWNIATLSFIKNYVYHRIKNNRSITMASLLTIGFTAFWHGLYPGYYASFF